MGNYLKFWKIVPLCLTFERQVAKSIRTLELNFNFLSSAPHSAQLMGVVMIGRSHARHAAKCSRYADMSEFLYTVMAGLSQARLLSVHSLGEVLA